MTVSFQFLFAVTRPAGLTLGLSTSSPQVSRSRRWSTPQAYASATKPALALRSYSTPPGPSAPAGPSRDPKPQSQKGASGKRKVQLSSHDDLNDKYLRSCIKKTKHVEVQELKKKSLPWNTTFETQAGWTLSPFQMFKFGSRTFVTFPLIGLTSVINFFISLFKCSKWAVGLLLHFHSVAWDLFNQLPLSPFFIIIQPTMWWYPTKETFEFLSVMTNKNILFYY
jgi:hypothetical protein